MEVVTVDLRMNLGGKPRRYEKPEDLEAAIDLYFNRITSTELEWDNVIAGYSDKAKKKPIIEQRPRLNNAGEQLSRTVYHENPSIMGLCRHIGILPETLSEYEKRDGYTATVKRAKKSIEEYAADQLNRREGQVTGIIFNLKNNFGWTDKNVTELQGEVGIKKLEDFIK
jgi:hypothetical protein